MSEVDGYEKVPVATGGTTAKTATIQQIGNFVNDKIVDYANINGNDTALYNTVCTLIDMVLEMQSKGSFTSALVNKSCSKPTIATIGNELPVGDMCLDFKTDTSKLSMSAENALEIYYTTNGTTPTKSSMKYEGELTLSSQCDIVAIGYNKSSSSAVPVVYCDYNNDTKKVSVRSDYEMRYTSDGSTPTSASSVLSNNTELSAGTYNILCNGNVSQIKIS